jgi:hypothetical protein
VSVTAGDFDGDGFVDLATANENSDDASVLLGLGTERSRPSNASQRESVPFPSHRVTSTGTVLWTSPSPT